MEWYIYIYLYISIYMYGIVCGLIVVVVVYVSSTSVYVINNVCCPVSVGQLECIIRSTRSLTEGLLLCFVLPPHSAMGTP